MRKGVLLVAAAIIQGVIAAAVTEEGAVGARVPGLEEDGAPFGAPFVIISSPVQDVSMCLAPGVPVSMRFKAHPGADRSMACENYHFVIFLDGTMVGLARASPCQSSSFCDGAWTLAPLQLGSHQLQVVFKDAFDYEYSDGVVSFFMVLLACFPYPSFLYAFHIAPLPARFLAACINSILKL
jgi:hypothetical protein